MAKVYIDVRIKYMLFSSDVNASWNFWTDLKKKFSNIKLDENLTSGSRDVAFGRTDMRKLIVAFRNTANAPENDSTFSGRDKENG
jgi:hypothetical protein